ncbi:MAG TPA: SGNH/GDSL hydrolase family protein [Candidatus Aquirickettsiella sp.]|jgi:phospholipase/lecithinase/hemolysin
MNTIPLHLTDLHKIASLNPILSKIKVSGIKILGDSLSDPGGENGMYEKKILGCIPLSLFLYKSPHEQFTNGYGWDYAFEKVLEFARESNNPLENPHLSPHGFFKFENRAQGGAMAYNYIEKIFNIIKFFRGFLLSLVLTNIQNEAKKLQKNIKLNPDDLAIIFAGANDLVTAGYCNKGGAERAIQGIAKTIDILTSSQQKNDTNYTKNVLVFTLPDFSKTPRFSKKTEMERKQAKEACGSFNEGLRDLAKNYQYFDFSLCDIYQVAKKEDVDPTEIKEKGIVITGLGSTKKIYFVNHGQFILKDNKEISVDIKLSQTEKKLLGDKLGKILKEGKVIDLEKLIHKLSSKAKLNTDVKIFDAAAVFDKIDEDPEAYRFTSGCAVYYLDKNQDKECISKNITSGNAIIIREINQEYNEGEGSTSQFCCYYVKNGKLAEYETNSTRIASITSFTISKEDKIKLQEKLKQHPLQDGISHLIGMEDKHASWTTNIIQSAIQAYAEKFKEKIHLTDIYASVLLAIKKNFPNQQDIFWDDLHPSVMVHFLLETMFEPFFKSNYAIKQPRVWQDDMAISDRVSPKIEPPAKSAESPDGFLSLKRHSLR